MATSLGNSDEENYKIAFAKARQWCASEEHCLWDAKQKLTRLGCTSSEISNIIQLLTAEGFINESRYALAFANGKFNLFKWGKNKIASGLRMKRIPEQFISIALESIDVDAYRDSLITLLNKKKRELERETLSAMKQKLILFALQKGYETEMIYAVLRMPDEIAMID